MTKAAVLPTPKHHDPDAFILPHNLEAEKSTLGAALVSTAAADYLADHLAPEAYFRRAHAIVFAAIRELRRRHVEVDFVTLKQQLDSIGKLEEVGGPAWLSALADGMPKSSNVDHYAEILKDLQAKRAIVKFSQRTIDLVAAAEHSSEAILLDADRRLMDLQAGHVDGRMRSVADSIADLSRDLEWRCEHKGELTGVDTGFASINELTLGWQAGDLIIVGARPSIGKTTFVVNGVVNAARSRAAAGVPFRAAIFSLEMRRRQLEYRILSQLAQVPLSRITGGYLGDPELQKISTAMCELAELRIEIDDRAGQSAWDIRSACRQLKAEGGLDLVVIDYVQLMPGSLERRGGSTRTQEIDDIALRLKTLGDEIRAPVVLLSQLSRDNEKRSDPRPKLSDLRESGALEQHADVVGFLHRKSHRESGTTNFILEKQRNGPTGTVNLSIDRDVVTFTDGGTDPITPAPVETDNNGRRSKKGPPVPGGRRTTDPD